MEFSTIPELVRWAGARWGDADALVDGDVRLSFAELASDVEDAARATVVAGVRPGDRVAIWAPNVWEWVVAALGASTAGGVLVPLNTRYKGHEAAYILRKSGARLLLCANGFLDTDYVGMLRAAGEDLPALERIVVIRGDAPDGTTAWEDFLAAGRSARDAALPDVAADDPSDILFTSGTTGKPKGATVTHRQSLRVFWDWSGILGLRETDRYLVVMPFFHTFGYKAGILAALMRGSAIVPMAVFEVPAVLEVIERERISMFPGAPTLYQSILNAPERAAYDLSSLRLSATGAAVVPVELVRAMHDELGFETVITAYGLTEATGTVTMCRLEDDPVTIATTAGRPIPDVEVRVVDDDGTEVPRGEPGEVVVRGYNVMTGYFEDPEQTAAAIDADGWLHTGDVGVMDDRGNLRITDRKKDMFIVGGFNAYPAEIEQSLLAHPQLAQVAVVGVPDDRLGEVGWAFVVPAAGESPDPDEVVAWARERLANYKVPRRVVVVDALPLNASGKVLKFELRDRATTV